MTRSMKATKYDGGASDSLVGPLDNQELILALAESQVSILEVRQ